ncbi:PKD domain-containing protein [Marinicellulosiphila megalodicopiae]|uniref:PKD domain-containing protein n=1 Tax=Marinicellulosiphila megalodicopiae TaxID=2724896 RepID=UPI003BAECE24
MKTLIILLTGLTILLAGCNQESDIQKDDQPIQTTPSAFASILIETYSIIVTESIVISADTQLFSESQLKYQWYIDNVLVSEQSTFTFQFNNTGIISIKLILLDSNSQQLDIVTTSISVTPKNVVTNQFPHTAIIASITQAFTNEVLVFSALANDTDGNIDSYHWQLNGQTVSTDPELEFQFIEQGNYTLSLQVTDNQGDQSNTAQIQILIIDKQIEPVNQMPTAVIETFFVEGTAPINIIISAAQSSDDDTISKYQWKINNKLVGSDRIFEYLFETAGDYVIELIVTDNEQYQSLAVTKLISIAAGPINFQPIAKIDVSATKGEAPLIVSMTAENSSDELDENGAIASYQWFVNDVLISEFATFDYQFDVADNYFVSLIVTDNQSIASEKVTQLIIVTDPLVNNQPIAVIEALPASGEAPLTVFISGEKSIDDQQIVEYYWSINDIFESAESSFEYTFTQAGVYNVELIVTDNLGKPSTKQSLQITVDPAYINELPVAHIDASVSTGEAPLSIELSGLNSTDNKQISSYVWSINGEFESNEATFSKTFSDPGVYQVELYVVDNELGQSLIDQQQIIVTEFVNQAPVATIFASSTNGYAPYTVYFNGSGSKDDQDLIHSYQWDVDHVNQSTDTLFSYTFAQAGVYDVGLTVTDTEQAVSTRASKIITVLETMQMNTPPTAKFTMTADELTVTVDASATTDAQQTQNLSYHWNFFNEFQKTTATPVTSYTFSNNGLKVITLEVTDSGGLTHKINSTIVVNVTLSDYEQLLADVADAVLGSCEGCHATNSGKPITFTGISGADLETSVMYYISKNNPTNINRVKYIPSNQNGYRHPAGDWLDVMKDDWERAIDEIVNRM